MRPDFVFRVPPFCWWRMSTPFWTRPKSTECLTRKFSRPLTCLRLGTCPRCRSASSLSVTGSSWWLMKRLNVDVCRSSHSEAWRVHRTYPGPQDGDQEWEKLLRGADSSGSWRCDWTAVRKQQGRISGTQHTPQNWATSECKQMVSKYVVWGEQNSSRHYKKLFSINLKPLLLCHVNIRSPHTCFCMYSWDSLKSSLWAASSRLLFILGSDCNDDVMKTWQVPCIIMTTSRALSRNNSGNCIWDANVILSGCRGSINSFLRAHDTKEMSVRTQLRFERLSWVPYLKKQVLWWADYNAVLQ